MREIKFRGMSLNGWIYGHYVVIQEKANPPQSCIWDLTGNIGVPVERDSVGQYTGLKDRNGKEIYEGDFIKNYLGQEGIISFADLQFFVNYGHGEYGAIHRKLDVVSNIYENI